MGMTLVDRAERIVAPIADVVELLPQHWIHGWEESLSFCRNCAEKKIAELKASEPEEEYLLDGGWRTEEDSQRFARRVASRLTVHLQITPAKKRFVITSSTGSI